MAFEMAFGEAETQRKNQLRQLIDEIRAGARHSSPATHRLSWVLCRLYIRCFMGKFVNTLANIMGNT